MYFIFFLLLGLNVRNNPGSTIYPVIGNCVDGTLLYEHEVKTLQIALLMY